MQQSATPFNRTFPAEVYDSICSTIYDLSLPPETPSLDPLIQREDSRSPVALPSTYPASYWSEPTARHTLASLCLVSKAWQEAAKPYLWRRVEIRLPRSWLCVLEEIGGGDAEDDGTQNNELIHESIMAKLEGVMEERNTGTVPNFGIPIELLSPPASREPSPGRLRAKSPGRWRILRTVSDLAERAAGGAYIPTPDDPRPGRHVFHLDFNHFRTIGMRRSVGEGVNSRFVTGDRVLSILREMPNLLAFGATEYMDGALTTPVLTELLLRGRRIPPLRNRGRLSTSVPSSDADDDHERRMECKPLEAIDLCGCVSAVFVRALAEFVAQNLLREDGTSPDEEDARGRVGRHGPRDEEDETPVATLFGLRRLGMRGVTSVPPNILNTFVLACPRLTHLDLSGTRVGPELLDALAESPSVKLVSLNLARCARLTGQSIVDFLCYGRSARVLTELCLYGDATLPSPLSDSELHTLVTEAPCFLSGALKYLDLSGAPITRAHLDRFVSQSALRSLGLSHISALPLDDVASFLLNKAPNTEILTLIGTSPELARGGKVSLALHKHIIRPLCTPPFRICGLTGSNAATADEIPTRLRVIELSIATLNGLGAGAGAWRIVRSKGGRGFYVDSSAGWVASSEDGATAVMRRDLTEEHPFRKEIERLAVANGNVSSGVGWHARKMEVLYGTGMMGREDGLYGAVSFAYQG
ncbi:F-box-like protein [Ceratobasidium sp. AG-Ba]|nr:F-box-like protein [Ceratobasidium sp. AG-Ba]